LLNPGLPHAARAQAAALRPRLRFCPGAGLDRLPVADRLGIYWIFRRWGPLVRSALLIFLGFLFGLSAAPALAEKRVALVIGMSRYQQVPQLANPARDAEAMSALFKRAGFDVIDSERDLGIADLRRVIREFSETSRDADISVVYYAGHGIEVDGANYLVPADARLLSDFDVEDETISLDRVLKALDPVKRLKLIILDACRDNPFSKTMKRSVASRSIGRGLAKVEPDGMSDTLIAFAAKAGAVASDGDGQNSPFATALVKYIAEPGLDLRIAFGKVRDDVLKSTSNRQEPFVYGSLGGQTMALVPQAVKPADPEAQARIDYELAAQIGTREAWDSFLASHATGLYANLAHAQNNKLAAAQQMRVKADDARRDAEEQAAQKTADLRNQLEEQGTRPAGEAKQKLSEQVKKDLEEARRQSAEQAARELDEAKHQVVLAQQQAEAARQQVEEAKRQAIADAQLEVEQAKHAARDDAEKLASLTPNQSIPPSPPSPPQMDRTDIARLLQAHLKRVGCNPGSADGSWDDGSKKALELFNKNARTKFDIQLASLDALDAVRSKPDRVCPLICSKGQRVDGDRCIQISCESGFFLNSSGACEKRPEPTPRARTATRQEKPSRRSGGGGKCFSFNGRSYCE
jgi:uncharacterized caspase-like protein